MLSRLQMPDPSGSRKAVIGVPNPLPILQTQSYVEVGPPEVGLTLVRCMY